MILRATIPPRPIADVEKAWPVDPDFDWNGETTGSNIELDAIRAAETLRSRLNRELEDARLSWGGDERDVISRAPRFRNQAALTLWLDKQIYAGKETVELTDFPWVVEYSGCLEDLIFKPAYTSGISSCCLVSASCPACRVSYEATDLKEIEYDLFFGGEHVLACLRNHHLLVLYWETYLLGG